MRVLVTGGAGYIGAHLSLALLAAGFDVVVVDNLSSGHLEALRRVEALAQRPLQIIIGDIADDAVMAKALVGVDTVFHLAAFKAVGDSMAAPERYFHNNIGGMTAMLSEMQRAGVTRIVYSSSAAVYGTQTTQPISETATLSPESPYGLTKAHGEQLLDWMARQRGWAVVSLRYFNPVGAHPSGRIGQPFVEGGSLVPRVLHALTQGNAALSVFGDDWPTRDGTCERDYVHICDLADAHLRAVEGLRPGQHTVLNVGTGRPHSVYDVLSACGRACGREVPFTVGPRRAGDMALSAADPAQFSRTLGFNASRDLDEMVSDAWRWWTHNPRGYA